jgi:hypothetical protein
MPTTLPVLTSEETKLYEAIYRCESCSHLTDPKGVFPFASRSAPEGQTVAVSHFGNVKSAPLWLLLTNPRGTDRSDANVGLSVRDFAANRDEIPTSEVPNIFQKFSSYNFDTSSPDFWTPWKVLLDDIKIGDKTVRFDSDGICAVDLIKCPTRGGWTGYVMKKGDNEGKEVWGNCHELGKRMGKHFLASQIKLHSPLVVIRPGTAFNGRGNVPTLLGTKRDPAAKALVALVQETSGSYVKHIYCLNTPKRLTIELGPAGEAAAVSGDAGRSGQCRNTIQNVIDKWLALTDA